MSSSAPTPAAPLGDGSPPPETGAETGTGDGGGSADSADPASARAPTPAAGDPVGTESPPPPAAEEPDDTEPKGPMRRCLITRAVHRREAMLRFVLDPEGRVTPDLDARLPGRGFWLSPKPDVVETAAAKGVFARAARRAVTVPPDLAARVDSLLEGRVVNLLGLARKAGQAVAGFEKTKAWIRQGRADFVLEAWDGAEGAGDRLGPAARGLVVHRALGRAALGRAFVRTQAVHAAVTAGGLGQRLQVDLVRLGRLRGRLDREDTAPTGGPRRDRRDQGKRPGTDQSQGQGNSRDRGQGQDAVTRGARDPDRVSKTPRRDGRRTAGQADTGGLPKANRKPV